MSGSTNKSSRMRSWMPSLYGSQRKDPAAVEPQQLTRQINTVNCDTTSAGNSRRHSAASITTALPPASPSVSSIRNWMPSLYGSRPTTPQKKDLSAIVAEFEQPTCTMSTVTAIGTNGTSSMRISKGPSAVPSVDAPLSIPDPSDSVSNVSFSLGRCHTSNSLTSPFSSTKASRPIHELDDPASQLILNALERTNSGQAAQTVPSTIKTPEMTTRNSGSFGKMMMSGLSVLSLSRTSTREDEKDKDKESRGRSMSKDKRSRSSSVVETDTYTPPDASRSRSRARSQSPFSFRRFRQRDPSPGSPQPLRMGSDGEFSENTTSPVVRPRTAFTDDPESGDEAGGVDTDGETDDEGWSDDDWLDPVTESNTEKNAAIAPVPGSDGYGAFAGLEGDVDVDADVEPDPTGEGVNVVIPPEPYFPSTLNSYWSSAGSSAVRGKRNTRRRKSTKHEPLQLVTSRPIFQRDRCTITICQGDPEGKLGDRRKRRYLVASDMSEESRYALEWGIGTVLRDGDEMMIVTVVENEGKVDPPTPNAADRATKLRSQQERQGLSYILVRQATSLLQRTRLNVTITCQAWHSKNARHMLLDIVDYNEPTMLIVGSRGLGQIKGILLGSTSHYLIQKCSVPVMVARRRLKRPARRSAHLATHRSHVSLAEAGIDRVAAKVDQDVKVMRDAMEEDDNRRERGVVDEGAEPEDVEADGDGDGDGDETLEGVKVPG